MPSATARRCLQAAASPPDLPITLAAEMEYWDGSDETRLIRLRAYEKSGLKKVDPEVVS